MKRRKELDDSHYKYSPPILESFFLSCPKCNKQVLLRSKFDGGNQTCIYGYTEPPEITEKPLIIGPYDYLEEDTIPVIFKDASQWLDAKGYKELISAFLKWAEPQVSKIEFEIVSKLISEETFWKFMDHERKGETEDAEEEG